MPDNRIQAFTDLEVWREGHRLVLLVYRTTRNFPKEEMYGLVSQMRRASVSVTSNVAEGFGRRAPKEKMHLYQIARGSLIELQNQLLVSKDVGFLTPDVFHDADRQCVTVHKLLNALLSSMAARVSDSVTISPYANPHIPHSRKGFTLPELIIVIGVMALLASLGLAANQGFLAARNFDSAIQGTISTLRRAQIRAVHADGGNAYGVRFTAGTGTAYTLFSGSTYATRDTSRDEAYDLPPSTGIAYAFPGAGSVYDVRFSRVRGRPAATGTIVLTTDGVSPVTIIVGDEGRIERQ